MRFSGCFCHNLLILAYFFQILISIVNGADIFLEWRVATDNPTSMQTLFLGQPAISINGMFPGPLINGTTNDVIHVNVFNDMDEPLLFTWNGIQQRLDSWQDGVSGTNCPIQPGTNWTYVFQFKDQIGSFFYFPSINFQKAGGGFGPIRVNNRAVIPVPFPKPEAEFDVLIGDWYQISYKDARSSLYASAYDMPANKFLINGKNGYSGGGDNESFTVTEGKTYRFRISNVGTAWSFNFMIQNHSMVLVETEGSYTNQIALDSLDVHVGQSYSVLVTADQNPTDYYVVATPKLADINQVFELMSVAVLHYDNSTPDPSNQDIPNWPDPFDIQFSIDQAKSIRWNMTTGAARPNPQGTFNVRNVTLTQTFILRGSTAEINGAPHYTINNVSYSTPDTPLKLADYYANGTDVFELDKFPTNSSASNSESGVFVASGIHKGWIELVFQNNLGLGVIDTWHLDGFGFFVVGFGSGDWRPEFRLTYNLHDPVVRSTVQVYPGGWTAVYAYLDNPGMWNLRSQLLKNWYLGQELYLRVYDPDSNPAKERPPPENLLLCGMFNPSVPAPAPSPSTPSAAEQGKQISWIHVAIVYTVTVLLFIKRR